LHDDFAPLVLRLVEIQQAVHAAIRALAVGFALDAVPKLGIVAHMGKIEIVNKVPKDLKDEVTNVDEIVREFAEACEPVEASRLAGWRQPGGAGALTVHGTSGSGGSHNRSRRRLTG
jgi:hypothetical protein